MRRIVAGVLIALMTLCLYPTTAMAVSVDYDGLWSNLVHLNSSGPYGVAANVHVLQRHPADEYSLVIIEGQTAYDGAATGFGWEITDNSLDGIQSTFRTLAHIKWPSSTNDTILYGQTTIAAGQYHNLKVERASSTSPYWNLCLDGELQRTIWWNYYGSSTYCRAQLETRPYDPVTSEAYLGHVQAYQVKAVNNNWYTIDSGWSVTPNWQNATGCTQSGSEWTNPFQTQYWHYWYDWEGDLPS